MYTGYAGGIDSTVTVFLIDGSGVSPANGSSTPPQFSALVDEHGIGGWAVSDENCLEGIRDNLSNNIKGVCPVNYL